jgi:hypothetical protein
MRYHFVVCFHWGEINPLEPNPYWPVYDAVRAEMKQDLAEKNVAWDATQEWLWLSLPAMREHAEQDGHYVPSEQDLSRRYTVSATPDMISGAFEVVNHAEHSNDRVFLMARYNAWPWNHAKGAMRAIAAAMNSKPETIEELITSFKETYYDGGWYDQLVKAGIPTPLTYIWRSDSLQDGGRPASYAAATEFFTLNNTKDPSSSQFFFLKTYKALSGKWVGGKISSSELREAIMEALRWIDRDETLMVREFVDLMSTGVVIGQDPADPEFIKDDAEWRYIFHNGNLIAKGPNRNYLAPEVLAKLDEQTDNFLELAAKANAALSTEWNCIDIAKTTDSKVIVVEVNAGISSGLPWNSAPNYYDNLFASIVKKEDSKP